MKTLQEQIAELTAKHEWDEYAKNLFPEIKHLAILHDDKKRIVAQCKNIDEFKTVFATLPPTNTETRIGFAGKHDQILKTPFRIDLKNPCRIDSYSHFIIQIGYWSNDIDVDIELPTEYIKEFVEMGKRPISDSEYHYFIGVSGERLRNMQVSAYSFKFSNDQISWYGGNKTLTSEKTISEIINHLTSSHEH